MIEFWVTPFGRSREVSHSKSFLHHFPGFFTSELILAVSCPLEQQSLNKNIVVAGLLKDLAVDLAHDLLMQRVSQYSGLGVAKQEIVVHFVVVCMGLNLILTLLGDLY